MTAAYCRWRSTMKCRTGGIINGSCNLTGCLQLCKLQRLKGPVCKIFKQDTMSFDQYKNHKWSKVWHTGPFNVRHCNPWSAENNKTTNVETSSPAVWILLNLAEPLRWRGYCGACLASWLAVGVAFAAGWVADVGLVMFWLVTVGDFRSAKWDPKKTSDSLKSRTGL